MSLKGALKNPNETRNTAVAATAGKSHPAVKDPSSSPPVPNSLRPVLLKESPCYLPQPEDTHPKEIEKMGPVDYWASGQVDWSHLSGLTGTRPVVDRYSISRYGLSEWRSRNKSILDESFKQQKNFNMINWNSRQVMEIKYDEVQTAQSQNTIRSNRREMEIFKMKALLEKAILEMDEEIGLVKQAIDRLHQAMYTIILPGSIASECLSVRNDRVETELVKDNVQDMLVQEVALIDEIKKSFHFLSGELNQQLKDLIRAKMNLEYDWSDKKEGHEIEDCNQTLNNASRLVLRKDGSGRFPQDQSDVDQWRRFSEENIAGAEELRSRSMVLRSKLDAVLNNAARDMKTQADKVVLATGARIGCLREVKIKMEQELKAVLMKLSDVEDLMIDLQAAIRRMEQPLKIVQTRLDNRLSRKRVENCRDQVQYGLVSEVDTVNQSLSALRAQLNQAESAQNDLIKMRNDLEREILMKTKSIEIDLERNYKLRDLYPSVVSLSGY